ncbi:winged helix DNA-binding domain-containing protein [Streptomyces sp. NBC_01012]|uniref:winged helix DNA-binding domain-containing protein n=1 Tax=Streptomyces sp. NBC_01012 TaxID=2903717 RepID=UPI00386DCAB7|nr:winged helix DNA-binding domain-containing protein [Streptomyces sp. NBC_01012]
MTATPVLTPRALGRALLARQFLLDRAELPAEDAVTHLVGMQAQAPYAPYFGLWTRLRGFRVEHLVDALNERRLLRIGLMRSTIHLVTPDDCAELRPWVQPALDRELNTAFRKQTEGLDRDEVAAYGREVLKDRALSTKELGELLHQRWPDREPRALTYVVRNRVPLVQVPPRGIWGVGGLTRYATVEDWTGHTPVAEPDPAALVLRYLAAFGPASVRDVQTWAGLVRLKAVLEELRPRLVTFRDESGVELFDLPDAPRPAEDTPAPVRFLPEYDNLLASHADRTRVVSDEHRKLIMTRNGMLATFLVDGRVSGTWRISRERDTATLFVEPFGKLSKKHLSAVAAEGRRLLGFAASDAAVRECVLPPA